MEKDNVIGSLAKWEHRPESYYEYPYDDLEAKDDRDHGRTVVTCPQCGWHRAWQESGFTTKSGGFKEHWIIVRCQRSARHGPDGWMPKCKPWKEVQRIPDFQGSTEQLFLF